MIRLHYSNRLENLIAPLADAIGVAQRKRPLDRVTIVVPSRVIEHFVKHRVSETIGIAANLDFPFLRRFLAGVLEKADPKLHILDVQELELVLFESLRLAMKEPARERSIAVAYLEQGNPAEKEKELRTLGLARQLARLFREYSIARRTLLQNWTKPDHASEAPSSDTERWQRELWRSIFGPGSRLRSEWKADGSQSDWMLLPNAFESVATSRLKVALPPVVHVFGLAYVGPAFLRIFSQLGSLIDLNIYEINPCREFWEDVEHLLPVERELWARRQIKVGDLERSPDPFELEAAGDTPALRLWARPGREFIRMLNEATECDFDSHFTARNPGRLTLLANLQEDILDRAPERRTGEPDFLEDDGSIRFLACPGLARETEIVANEIWSMLENDTRGHDAPRFHQIGVLVPDALYQDYLPHLESAFSRLHRLPINVVDRGFGSESPVLEAILLLLQLPLGRFSRDEMLHLLCHPVISGTEANVVPEQASRWCEELGIFFGADSEDLADTYIPSDTYHWDQGIRRLALGVFMGEEPKQEARFYRGPGSIDYLPYETVQEEIPAVAAFVRNARRLLSDATGIRSRAMTLPQWSRLLSDLIVSYIEVDDPADERMLERCVEAVESIADPQLRSTPVSYPSAYAMVGARLADTESRPAQFSEQGIAVGPLSALRAIPFRAIFLLGLNETQFPERDHRDPMDLRLARRKAGDVTPTERDRYLFLETLLAARERLCMSYVARDAKSGEQLDPSSVVRELQFILRRYVDRRTLDRLTIEHPLSRYDRRYFPDLHSDNSTISHNLTSYDPEARRGAIMTALRGDLALHCDGLPLSGRDEPIYQQLQNEAQKAIRPALRITEVPRSAERKIEATEISLPIAALRKFLECPLQGAAQYALRIFQEEVEDLEQWQDEPIAQSILERTTMLREVFWKARGNRELLATEFKQAFRISQLAGRAPAGPFGQAAKRVDFESMQHWIDEARSGGGEPLDQWNELRMGSGDESAKDDRRLAELVIPCGTGLAGDTHDRMVRIHGSLGFVSQAGDASLRLVLRDKPRAKDFLGAFLSGIVLAAAGKLDSGQFRAVVVGAKKNQPWKETRSLVHPSAEQARNYLSDLVTDLLFAKNHYFFPIEAVEKVDKQVARGRGGDLMDLIYDARDDEFARVSSDYGPIRNARRFDPPSLETLMRIMNRRFGLIRAIFEREKH